MVKGIQDVLGAQASLALRDCQDKEEKRVHLE